MSCYEIHKFSRDLPVIYHRDHLRKGIMETCISNWHENLELLYCIEGQCTVVINTSRIAMEKGNILVINSGDIHYVITDTKEAYYDCLIISADFLKEFGIDVEHLHFCENVTDGRGITFFERFVQEQGEKDDYYQLIIRAEILSYAAHLCRRYASEAKERCGNDRIKRGIVYIREHFTEELKVEEIAAHAGFSRFYFSRQFKNNTGMTVMKYVEFLRCRHAKELLEKGTSVTSAALDCGFSDVSYFTKVFKRQYGILPSEWKRSASGNA